MATIRKSKAMAFTRFSQWYTEKQRRCTVSLNPLHAGVISKWPRSEDTALAFGPSPSPSREDAVSRVPSASDLEMIAIDPPREWIDEPEWDS